MSDAHKRSARWTKAYRYPEEGEQSNNFAREILFRAEFNTFARELLFLAKFDNYPPVLADPWTPPAENFVKLTEVLDTTASC